MINRKTRACLFGIVALYLLHISYELFKGRGETDTTMTPAARIVFIVFFVLAAVGLGIYAVRTYRSSGDDDQPPKDDKNNLK